MTTAKRYEARDDGGSWSLVATTREGAIEEAQDRVGDGYDAPEETQYVSATVYEVVDEDGDETEEEIDTVEGRIDPREPKCDGSEHDWQAPHSLVGGLKENPGVHANGGGVVIKEVCMICGCKRTTDTWGQDGSTGRQGLEVVSYSDGEYRDKVQAMRDDAANR